MGTFYVVISIGDPSGRRFEELQALVDTGATWTLLPGSVLTRLGHVPTFKRQFKTADGRVIERGATVAPIRLGDETLPNICIFGDEGSEILLGVTTMEGFSVAPDPVNQRLVPVAGLLMTLPP